MQTTSTKGRTVIARIPAFSRNASRREDHEGGRGYSLVPDGHEYADIEVSLDLERLLRALGPKAMVSKARKSSGVNGAIEVRAVNVRRVP